MNKTQSDFTPQYMPITCGGYHPGLPMPASQGSFPSQMQNGTVMGTPQSTAAMPTGFPTGGTASPLLPTPVILPSTITTPGMPASTQVPATVESVLFTPGFLRTQIGKKMRVEFLIGTNGMTDRTGTLVAVGASYIIIRPIESDDLMLCDIYSIKFATIIK